MRAQMDRWMDGWSDFNMPVEVRMFMPQADDSYKTLKHMFCR